MLPILVGAAVAGTLFSIYGELKSASDQAAAKRRDAYLKGLQGKELQERQSINSQIVLEQGEQEISHITSSFGSGFQGTGVAGKVKLHSQLLQNIALMERDTNFKAKMLAMGAEGDRLLADNIITAGNYRAAGTLFSGVAQAGLTAQSGLAAQAAQGKG